MKARGVEDETGRFPIGGRGRPQPIFGAKEGRKASEFSCRRSIQRSPIRCLHPLTARRWPLSISDFRILTSHSAAEPTTHPTAVSFHLLVKADAEVR